MSSTKEIAAQIRQDLKAMKGYTFSVHIENYSGGSSISVDVMTAPVRTIRTIAEIPELSDPERTGRYTRQQIAEMQAKRYHQLNQHQLRASDEYRAETWNNGVFLTEAGHNDLKKIVAIVEKYHRDSSDSSIDYFCCNFYFHLNLGKWDKAFVDGITDGNILKTSEELGRKAYHKGISAPVCDPDMMGLIKGCAVGEATEPLTAWLNGWTRENLKPLVGA